MFLTFINAIGIVMFPLLRRSNKEKLPWLFKTIRDLFVPITYSFLIFYVPARYILSMWLPEYADSLQYMGILFPIVIYEGRMSLLINTYLKTIRKEKTILFVNILTLSLTLLFAIVIIFLVGNIMLAVGLILFSLALRCNLAEFFLCKYLDVKVGSKIILETVLTILFIIGNIVFNGGFLSMVVYLISFLVYIFIIRKIW